VANKSSRSTQISKIRLGLTRLIVAFLLALSTSCGKDQSAHIRVNQLGYELGLPMRGYLMTSASQPETKFAVKNAEGAVSYSGVVGPSLGKWGKYTVYGLDFAISAPGSYTISVIGEVNPDTPSAFRVEHRAHLYSAALVNALSFYQNQRDGADYLPSSLRTAPAHLNDQRAKVYKTPEFAGREGSRIKGNLVSTGAVIDASGGWWDAGDYLKFVETHSTALALMLIGVRDFPSQLGASSSASNFTAEAKFGLDWLLRMWHDTSSTLYYQVGIGSWNWHYENDHSVWRLAQEDDTYRGTDPSYRYIRNRPVFIAAPAGAKISPNLAGRLAGDFALCFMVYRTSNRAYANQCLVAAEHIFDLADTAPAGELLTAAPHDFYPEADWRDDLEFGATELFFATRQGDLPSGLPHSDPSFYLQAAAEWANAYMQSKEDKQDWSFVDHLAQFELWRALGVASDTKGLAVSQTDLVNDLRTKLESAAAQADADPFGLGYSAGRGEYTFQGARFSAMASEYDFMTKSNTFAKYSTQWLANILGANAWGSTFIVGDGSTFPHCPHHQIANLVGSHDGRPLILAGAMVAGPNADLESGTPGGVLPCSSEGLSKFDGNGVRYRDSTKFYSTVEPAIDFTSSSLLMFAWRAAGAPSDAMLQVHRREQVAFP
jgi:endoglucanase